MTNTGQFWTPEEDGRLLREGHDDFSLKEWEALGARFRNRSGDSLRQRYAAITKGKVFVPESPYPKYDSPLVMQGNTLVLNDLEAPFHHAAFVNRCLDLAEAWGIRKLVLGGDAIHNEALSTFDPAWQEPGVTVSPEIAAALADIASSLPKKQREQIVGVLEEYTGEPAAPGFSQEMSEARRVMDVLADRFDEVHLVLGNHEGRYLRMLASPVFADHILTELHRGNDPRWKALPYYYSHIESGGERFRVTHPKATAKYTTAWKLAAKFGEHVLMAHNHHLNYNFDISGRYYAIETGCCVDESRLPYAAQRDNTQYRHILGAVIVRDGVPWLLHERVDWERLKRAT